MSDTQRGQIQEQEQYDLRPSMVPQSPCRSSDVRLMEENFKMDITSEFTEKKKANSEKGKDDEVIAQWKRESEQMLLTDLMVNRPFLTLIVGYAILILLTKLSVDLNYFEVSDTTSRDFQIWSDPMTVDLDMYKVASEFFDEEGDLVDPVQGVRSQRFLPAFLLYTNIDNPTGLLRKDILLNIQKLENAIQDFPGFKDFCQAQDDDNSTCSNITMSTPLNVLREMNVTKELKDMGQLEIEELFRTAFETIEVRPKIMANFDKNVSGDNMTVTYMRTIISMGTPLDINGTRYMNVSDRSSEQWDHTGNFSSRLRDMVEEGFGDQKQFGCQINFASILLSLDIFIGMILNDVLFALFSVGFVFFYFIIHMKSKFMSFIGTTIILFSFPITVCITEGIGGVTYVGSLQVIAIYMVLGIAADDIFVFIDAWKRSANLSYEVFQGSKQKRMAYAFRSSARAMAITSSTTSVAFFANIFSPLLPIKTFGIFSGVIIPVNFFLVVMFMPPAAIIYEEYIEDAYICCFKCKSLRENKKKVSEHHNEKLNQNDEENEEKTASEDQASTNNSNKKENKLGPIEKFFDGPLNKFVYKYRKQIVFGSFVWFFYACGQATQLGPQTEQEEFIDPEHPAILVYSRMSSEFPAPLQRLEAIDIYWGVKGIDRTGESQWDPEFIGAPIFDKAFDVTTLEAQKWFIGLCDELNKQSFVTFGSVKCWMKDFEKYVEDNLEERFPVRSKKDFMRFINKWIDDEDEFLGAYYQTAKFFGISDNEIIFSKINSASILGKNQASGEDKQVEYEKWQEFVTDQEGQAPPEMKNFRQTTGAWPQIATESAFVENALQGVVISIFFAFLILLYATGNVIQSVVSIFCVTIVIVSIMTFMHMRDLKLGTAESISLVVLIGFSVDYIVHLSADYMHSAHVRRYDKMRQAYREMGVSILSGCITTFGCGFCLFFGNFTFFQTFGLVVTCTVGTSFIVAMFTFGSLMHLWGPQKQFGMLIQKAKVETKEEREEIEMKMGQIDENSSLMSEKIGSKINEMNDKSKAQFDKMTEEMDEVREGMAKENAQVKKLLNQILVATEKPTKK